MNHNVNEMLSAKFTNASMLHNLYLCYMLESLILSLYFEKY